LLTRPPAPAETAAPPAVQAPSTATPAPAPPVAAAPLDLHGQFQQLVASHTAGFDVLAQAERTQLRIDRDELRFSVSSSRDGHVYVLLAGPDGSLMQLYPNDKARNNRIAAGQTLKLPQAGWPLKASEPAGLEHFLVLVTAEPRSFAPWSTGKDSGYGLLSLPSAAPATGGDPAAPSWLLGLPDCGRPACAGEFGAAVFSVDVVR
ncbi:MAG TPA: DUF4384 domain-containing protein, partial [Roseateles sp.]